MPTQSRAWPDILQCPACHARLPAASATGPFACGGCGRTYPVVHDIPQLLCNLDDTTQLDEEHYDTQVNINDRSLDLVRTMWSTVLADAGTVLGDVLEVGCGSGQLTTGLAGLPFRHVHASDISHPFLQKTRQRVETQHPGKTTYWRCDANQLPFADNTFDQIVGNSVLHHFLDYRDVLRTCYRVLRPGGAAFFFEPVLQGKLYIALMARLLLQADEHASQPVFDERERRLIAHLVTHITKHFTLGDDRERLARMEDKYVFDCRQLQAEARQAGFARTSYRNNPLIERTHFFNLERHLKQMGIPPAKAAAYPFIAESFNQLLSLLGEEDVYTPMGFFIFQKT